MSSRRTKIVCTIGPAVDTKESLKKLVEAGMNVARLNFSHGNHPKFSQIIQDIRALEDEFNRPIGIMADIQGPKMRVGKLQGGSVQLTANTDVFISESIECGGEKDGVISFSTGYKDFVKDVGPGNIILLDDGLLSIKVRKQTETGLHCDVIDGGTLKENKGINVPNVSFSIHSITEKDYDDILFAMEKDVDFIALSFVRSDQEVRHLKNFIHSRGKRIQVIAKIEKREALNQLEEIIAASDGILVARGDLAVEVGNERVPVLQKRIVRACNLRAKTVIIATQMLMSMVENPRPSRAEASDVANAIVDGADAVMLSNETAVGKYPVESIQMMNKIVVEMELDLIGAKWIESSEWKLPADRKLAMALLQGAVQLASTVDAKFIVVVTQSGQSSSLVSKCRPKNRLLAITGSKEAYRRLTLKWGVEPLFMEDMSSLIDKTSVFESIGKRLSSMEMCQSGDRVVITAGLPRLEHGSTNTIKFQKI